MVATPSAPPPPRPPLIPTVSRRRVGVLAIGCLGLAGLLRFAVPEQVGPISALFRVGVVLAALWLAMPAQGQPLLWRNFVPVLLIGLAMSLLSRNPRLLLIIVPVGFALLLLLSFLPSRPRRK